MIIISLGLILTLLVRRTRSRNDDTHDDFEKSERNLNDLKDLTEPNIEFKAVMEEVGSMSTEVAEKKDSSHYHDIEGDDEDGNSVYAREANPISSKLDLARAYIDMGEGSLAGPLLDEILEEGSDEQVDEARGLIVRLREL